LYAVAPTDQIGNFCRSSLANSQTAQARTFILKEGVEATSATVSFTVTLNKSIYAPGQSIQVAAVGSSLAVSTSLIPTVSAEDWMAVMARSLLIALLTVPRSEIFL
ncbi:MAG: hypothetical protein ACREXX_17295, partial [Gammaproteobacteria bacterium]